MPLKYALTAEEHTALSDDLKSLYTEQDGNFVLQVEGAVADSEVASLSQKIKEFRDTNITLKKQLEGVDLDALKRDAAEVTTLKAKLALLEKSGGGSLDEAVKVATKKLEDRIAGLEDERDRAQKLLEQKKLDDKIWALGQKSGVEDWAKEFFLEAGRKVFVVTDADELEARQGDRPMPSQRRNKSHETMSPEEWAVEVMPRQAPGLYKGSGGASSRGRQTDRHAGDGRRVLAADNPLALGDNAEALAKGEVTVVR